MNADCRGLPVSGADGDAIVLLDAAVDSFNRYRGDPLATLGDALQQAPGFAMAHLTRAWLLALSTEPAATAAAREDVTAAAALPIDAREAGHIAALEEGDL